MPYTLPINSPAPPFKLLGTDNRFYTLESFKEAPYLVIFFTCNHCPYVIGSDEYTRSLVNKYDSYRVKWVGINSNSAQTYASDSFDNMVLRMKEHKFPWVYLHDKTQEIAKAYGALRTPQFYLFDQDRLLRYDGRSVDNPRLIEKASSFDLDRALGELVAGQKISTPLTNPIGCNIKWEGKDPHWMPLDACDLI